MSVLFVAVPVALAIALFAVIAFVFQVRSGQYDDLETPAIRILFDDESGQRPVTGKARSESRKAGGND